MNYETWRTTAIRNIHSLTIKTLVGRYRRGRPTVVLLPGGMGSQLDRSLDAHSAQAAPPQVFDTVWADIGLLFNGDALTLEIDGQGRDRDRHAIIANGPLDFLIRAYDGTDHRPHVGLYAARRAVRLPPGHELVRRLPHPCGRSAGIRARGGRPRKTLGRAGHLARRKGCIAGAARVGTGEGWFVGDHSITGGQTASTPILHVEVNIELAVGLLQAFGLDGQTAVKATASRSPRPTSARAPCR